MKETTSRSGYPVVGSVLFLLWIIAIGLLEKASLPLSAQLVLGGLQFLLALVLPFWSWRQLQRHGTKQAKQWFWISCVPLALLIVGFLANLYYNIFRAL